MKGKTEPLINDVLSKKSGAKDTFKAFIETLGKETEEDLIRLVRNTQSVVSVNTLPNLEIRMRELLKDIPKVNQN